MIFFAKAHPAQQAMSRAATPADLNEAGFRRNPGEPGAAEAEAGTYQKPRVQWRGLTIAIENPAGSVRRGRNRHGVTWEVRMRYDYGEVVGSMGVDGDPVDIYLGPALEDAPMVYVVHQRRVNDWESYDEDKVMAGFMTEEDAREAFLSNYNDPRFLGPITAMPVDEFVAKVRATREKPAMIKSILFFKAHVGPYLRGGKIVNVAGYQGRSARAVVQPGQMSLFGSNKPLGPSPLNGKDAVAHTPDLFDADEHGEMPPARRATREPEPRAALIAEHERLVDVLNSPSHADDKVEAKKQAAELAEMKGEGGPEFMYPSLVDDSQRKKIEQWHKNGADPATRPDERAIYLPGMSASKLKKLLDKSAAGKKLTSNDIEDIKDYKYLILAQPNDAEQKGFLVRYTSDHGGTQVPKDKFLLTNIEHALSQSKPATPQPTTPQKPVVFLSKPADPASAPYTEVRDGAPHVLLAEPKDSQRKRYEAAGAKMVAAGAAQGYQWWIPEEDFKRSNLQKNAVSKVQAERMKRMGDSLYGVIRAAGEHEEKILSKPEPDSSNLSKITPVETKQERKMSELEKRAVELAGAGFEDFTPDQLGQQLATAEKFARGMPVGAEKFKERLLKERVRLVNVAAYEKSKAEKKDDGNRFDERMYGSPRMTNTKDQPMGYMGD